MSEKETCKLCGYAAPLHFALPRSKKTGHPIPNEPDDAPYYQCARCTFLFSTILDSSDHTEIYDDTYWDNQDPDWYGRVSETMRLILLSNELLRGNSDEIDILDFGCGSGGFLEVGRRNLQLNVWGTDIIPPKVGKEWFIPKLEGQKFDIITACEVIEHLPRPRETFDFIRSHLKSPGVFAFQTAEWDPRVVGRDWWYLGPANGHISLYTRAGLDWVSREMGVVGRRLWRNYSGLQAWLFY